jgi:hypothetical protein
MTAQQKSPVDRYVELFEVCEPENSALNNLWKSLSAEESP